MMFTTTFNLYADRASDTTNLGVFISSWMVLNTGWLQNRQSQQSLCQFGDQMVNG